jgi:phosphoglycerate dehydrogenase-like enzyme
MTEPRIKVATPSFGAHPELRDVLERSFHDVVYNETGRILTTAETADFLQDADGALVGREPIDVLVLERCKRLRIVAKYGVGLDNIDEDALRVRGVVLGWTPGVNRRSVSELALCAMIGLLRQIVETSTLLRQGTWKKEGGRELSGSTVGIVGLGNVGSDLARLLGPFGCTVLCNDVRDVASLCAAEGWVVSSKERIWAEADVVSLHVPLTPLTEHLVDRSVLRSMRSDAYLINTSRGRVVDEEALLEALQDGTIAGAALDVFAVEPMIEHGLVSLPNVLATPHIGGSSRQGVLGMGLSAVDHLRAFFAPGGMAKDSGSV